MKTNSAAGQLTITERIAVTNYLLKHTDESKLLRIMDEIIKNGPPIPVSPTIDSIRAGICKYYKIEEKDLRSPSKKKSIAQARMVYVKVAIDLYLDKRESISKAISSDIGRTIDGVSYLYRKASNLVTIYKEFANEVSYLSLNISWKYYKQLEGEGAQ